MEGGGGGVGCGVEVVGSGWWVGWGSGGRVVVVVVVGGGCVNGKDCCNQTAIKH